MKASDLGRLHGRYLAALRRTPRTQGYYLDCLKRLDEFMLNRGVLEVEGLSRLHMMEFPLWLRERGLSPGGEAAVMRGVRAALRWGFSEEVLPTDLMKGVRLAPVPVTRPPHVTPEIARRAITASASSRAPLRDRALMLLMIDTGIRMGELLALRSDDIDALKGFVRVRAETSKRQRERRIPFGLKCGRALQAYERRERKPGPRAGEDAPFFLTRSGIPLTDSGLHHMLDRTSERIGEPRANLAPHAWRRGFATLFMQGGGDLATLQLMMGHATLDQTRVYLRLSDEDLQRAHVRAGVADRL